MTLGPSGLSCWYPREDGLFPSYGHGPTHRVGNVLPGRSGLLVRLREVGYGPDLSRPFRATLTLTSCLGDQFSSFLGQFWPGQEICQHPWLITWQDAELFFH